MSICWKFLCCWIYLPPLRFSLQSITHNLCTSFSFSLSLLQKFPEVWKMNFKLASNDITLKLILTAVAAAKRRGRKIVYHKFPHNYISNIMSGMERKQQPSCGVIKGNLCRFIISSTWGSLAVAGVWNNILDVFIFVSHCHVMLTRYLQRHNSL